MPSMSAKRPEADIWEQVGEVAKVPGADSMPPSSMNKRLKPGGVALPLNALQSRESQLTWINALRRSLAKCTRG